MPLDDYYFPPSSTENEARSHLERYGVLLGAAIGVVLLVGGLALADHAGLIALFSPANETAVTPGSTSESWYSMWLDERLSRLGA